MISCTKTPYTGLYQQGCTFDGLRETACALQGREMGPGQEQDGSP